MSAISRRQFMQISGSAAAISISGFSKILLAGKNAGHVVIIGAGIGGATAARYIKRADPAVDVTLIEPDANYYTGFMSNEVISGQRSLESLKFGYNPLQSMGIKIIRDYADNIDTENKRIITKSNDIISYDRCIVSPGVDFKWQMIAGYNATIAAEKIPHAWQAGPQTLLLRRQLEAMQDGGQVIISVPPNPYRCPPGPYERASQIAYYLKHHKPKSKVLLLDAKDNFAKFELFIQGWKKYYGYGTDNSLIEWIKGSEGGNIDALNIDDMTLISNVDKYKGDVINIIPAQKAGKIAFNADLVNNEGWCPVNQQTFESTRHKDVYVIGDSSVASPLPKSAYAANSEAKVCAAAVVASLHGQPAPEPTLINTCYSLITPDDGVSVAMVYHFDGTKIQPVKGAGGQTPLDSSPEIRKREANYAHSWFNNISHDTFGG